MIAGCCGRCKEVKTPGIMDKPHERVSVAESTVRYYLCRKALTTPSSLRREALRQLYYSLQFLPLFLSDSQHTRNLPWSFTTFWWLWDGISLLTRLQSTAQLLGLNVLIFLIGCAVVVGTRVLCCLTLILNNTWLTLTQFDEQLLKNSYSTSIRFIYRVDHFLGSVMSFYFPLNLVCFLTAVTAGVDSLLTGTVYTVIAVCCLVASVIFIVMDRTYLAILDWTENQLPSLSSPLHSAVFAGLDIASAIASAAIPFATHSTLYVGLLSALAVLRVMAVWLYLPYHHPFTNWMESTRGLVVCWGLVLVTIGLNFDPDGHMPALSLLLISPLILYFNWQIIQHLSQTYTHPSQITNIRQLEFVLRNELSSRFHLHTRHHQREKTRRETNLHHQRSERIEQVIEQLEIQIKNSRVAIVWLLNFARLQEDLQRIKILRAQLHRTPGNAVDAVAAQHCYYTLEKWLLQLHQETEVVDFLSYEHDLSEVLAMDLQTTRLHRDILEELSHRHRSFSRIVQLSHRLNHWLRKTLATYRQLLTSHPQSLDVLTLFISLLDLIGQPTANYENLLRKMEAVDRHKLRIQTMNEPGNVAFIISLETEDFGMVRWARNAEALGFGPAELQGVSHLVFIPEPIRSHHNRLLRRAQQLFSRLQAVFSGVHRLYMCHRNGMLLHGSWLVRLGNARPQGDLVAVVSIRLSEEFEDVAFLDLETQQVTAMTTGFQAFCKEQGFNTSSIVELFGMRISIEDCRNTHLLRNTLQADLCAEILPIFGKYEQPILRLHTRNEGSVRPSFSEIDLSRRFSQIRGVSFYPQEDMSKAHLEPAPSNTYSDSRSMETASHLAKLKRTSARYERLFLLALFISVVLAGCTAALVVVYIKRMALDLDNSVSEIGDIGARRYQVAVIALSTRMLQMAAAQTWSPIWNETEVREALGSAANELLTMRNTLESSSDTYSGGYNEYVMHRRAPFWQWEGGAFRLEHLSLIDLMTKIAHSALQLYETPLSSITPTNSDFLTLYRNCAAESMDVLNFTVDLYMQATSTTRENNEVILSLLVYMAMLLLSLLTLGALLPLVITSSLRRKKMWNSLLTCSSTEVAILKVKATERLLDTHGQEETKTAGRARGGSANYSISGVTKLLLVCLVLYLCCTCVVLYLIYTIGVSKSSLLLLEKPHYMNWGGERRALVVLTNLWLREIWLERTPYSLPHILPSNQHISNPSDTWSNFLSLLLSVQTSITYGDPSRHLTQFLPSNSRKQALQGTCDTCEPEGQRGLTPLIYELAMSQRSLARCIQQNGSFVSCDGPKTGATMKMTIDSLDTALGDLDSESSAALSNYQTTAELLTISFGVFSLFLLVLVFLPLVRKVTSIQMTSDWQAEMSLFNILPRSKTQEVLITSARPGVDSKRD